MMKMTFLAITLFISVTNFGAAQETDNDLMRKFPLCESCPFCPIETPMCCGFCNFDLEKCDGYCTTYGKPPKVSTSDKLKALDSALFSLTYGADAGKTVSMFNGGVCFEVNVALSSGNGDQTQFTVNSGQTASGQFNGALESIRVTAQNCDDFITCTLTTSQAGSYAVFPQKNKKGEIIGCVISKQ